MIAGIRVPYRVIGSYMAFCNASVWMSGWHQVRSISTVALAEQQYKPSKAFEADSSLAPVLMLHGLFGSKQNYGSVGRAISKQTGHAVYGVDLRNHGDSPHASPYDYYTLAQDVIRHIKERGWTGVVLAGHSMGAKTAMVVSLLEPELVSKLVVIDNSPVEQALDENFTRDLEGMCKVEEANAERALTDKEIDNILQTYEPDVMVRTFLKTNVIKKRHQTVFRLPVLSFRDANLLQTVGEWPSTHVAGKVFRGPTVVMSATHSPFVQPHHHREFSQYFPNHTLESYDCGHWVVSDRPKQFIASMVKFLTQKG